MSCEYEIFDKKTRAYSPCSHYASVVIETLIDSVTTRRCCCGQHRLATIELMITADQCQFGHGKGDRNRSDVINIHFSVTDTTTSSSEHRGTVHFGPVTEQVHLEQLYDEYFDEYSLIGMYDLQYESDSYRETYDDCLYNMNYISDRLLSFL